MVRAVPASEGCMTKPAPSSAPARRAIRVWLLVVAALMVVTVVVGGATRLTESGLSIVEWKPVTGVLPPLDAQAWQIEFDKYKTIPQYRERNAGMSLADFKTIYWWEWTHRVLARLVGGVFLLPLLWFLWRGQVEPHLRARRRRVVDGRLRAQRARQRVAISAGVPPDAGVRHLCRHPLDRAEPRAARAGRRA